MHVTQTAAVVSFEDTTGNVLREVATVPAEADTFARAPGAHRRGIGMTTVELLSGVAFAGGPKITEMISIKDKGKTLVIDIKVESNDDTREFKRVYNKVTHT